MSRGKDARLFARTSLWDGNDAVGQVAVFILADNLAAGVVHNAMMTINIAILVCEIIGILSINRLMSRQRFLIRAMIISFLIFLIGIIIRNRIPGLDYRLLIIPFIQILLQSICHYVFQKFFEIPFYINIRGQEFPNEMKTETNGFEVLLSTLLTFIIFGISLITFFVLK